MGYIIHIYILGAAACLNVEGDPGPHSSSGLGEELCRRWARDGALSFGSQAQRKSPWERGNITILTSQGFIGVEACGIE